MRAQTLFNDHFEICHASISTEAVVTCRIQRFMDPGTALQVAGAVYNAAKALYSYAKAVKGNEKDAAKLQESLTWLYNLFKSVESALQLHIISNSNRKLLEDALVRCRRDALQLSSLANRACPSADTQKARARRFMYPFRKPTIKEVLEQVRVCQDQLAFALEFLQVDATLHSRVLLEQTNETTNKTRQKIDEAKETINQTNETLNQVAEDLRSKEERAEARRRRKAQRIVDSLGNNLSEERRLRVENAYAETFQWIFHGHIPSDHMTDTTSLDINNECSDSEDSDRSLNDSRFATWLRQEGDVFWIRGKAGSGKSTLMKFLLDSKTTRQVLSQWAGDQELIIAEHFFWVAGPIQLKSRHGMLQHLLYQVLAACPQLISMACQNRWNSEAETTANWSTDELMDALNLLAQVPSIRLCLFVDGLDECSPESEHRSLVNGILKLASYDSVKLIVSSRPWPVFDCCLTRRDIIIALEDLTRGDMLRCVRDELIEYSCGQIPADMKWTYHQLVDQRYSDLPDCPKKRTAELVLEEYFRAQIKERMHPTMVADNAIILNIMTKKGRWIGPRVFEISWILSQKGRDFFNDPLFYLQPCSSLPVASFKTIEETVRSFIAQCCKDLLYVHNDCEGNPSVEFLHRTVLDFLNTKEMQWNINSYVLDHFDMDYDYDKLELLSIKLQIALAESHTSSHAWMNRCSKTCAGFICDPGFHDALLDRFNDTVTGALSEGHLDHRDMVTHMENMPSQVVEELGSVLLRYLWRLRGLPIKRCYPIIGNLLACLIDKGFHVVAYELLEAMPAQFEELDDYELPLLMALGANLRGQMTFRRVNNPLIEKIIMRRDRYSRYHYQPNDLVLSPWQIFLLHLAFAPRGEIEYHPSRTVDSLRALLPRVVADDGLVFLAGSWRLHGENECKPNGRWTMGERVPSLKILRALLPSDDFEVIRQECSQTWRMIEAAPVSQQVAQLDDGIAAFGTETSVNGAWWGKLARQSIGRSGVGWAFEEKLYLPLDTIRC